MDKNRFVTWFWMQLRYKVRAEWPKDPHSGVLLPLAVPRSFWTFWNKGAGPTALRTPPLPTKSSTSPQRLALDLWTSTTSFCRHSRQTSEEKLHPDPRCRTVGKLLKKCRAYAPQLPLHLPCDNGSKSLWRSSVTRSKSKDSVKKWHLLPCGMDRDWF